MEYNPRYPQPFSLSQAIALDPAVVLDEVSRLRNSLMHLRRSQDELREYLRGLASKEVDQELSQAVQENEITIASQDERIFMLKLALAHHGHSVSQQMSFPPAPAGSRTMYPQNAVRSSSSGLDDFSPVDRVLTMNPETQEAEQQEDGVYL